MNPPPQPGTEKGRRFPRAPNHWQLRPSDYQAAQLRNLRLQSHNLPA
jgi:hypothetical protein